MLKKTITYRDLDDNPVTEEFHFHLRKADVAAMELSKKGGLTEYVKRIVAEEDGDKLVEIFKDLLVRTVGKRHEDGRQFIRSQEIIDAFVNSDAYSEMFMMLSTDHEQAVAFINNVIPASMRNEANASTSETVVELPAVSDNPPPAVESAEPAWVTEGRIPTPEELRNATPEQIQLAFKRKQAVPEITPPLA